jgi:sodium-dependent dicarboxylate transporter 2/3/5
MRNAIVALGLALLLAATQLPPPAGLSAHGWLVLALLVVMAFWWLTEALPVTATALLPFVVLPLGGVARLDAVAQSYMAPVIFLVLGGALVALAMENCGLHRRIALVVVSRSSPHPRALVLSFMAATAFISMWVSNTATALIMMPIATAVLAVAMPPREGRSAAQRAFAASLVLGVAYAASIGGLGTLVGSPTNGIAVGLIDRTLGIRIGFLDWLAFGLPLVAITVPATWWLLTRVTFRYELPDLDRERMLHAIGSRGPMSTAERRLVPLLLATAAAWVAMPLLRKVPGLAAIDDSVVAIVSAMLLFVIPGDEGRRLLDWRDTARAPWDVLILFGGGLALAAAITDTGLGAWIGLQLRALDVVPVPVLALVATLLVIVVTEFASNVAAAASFVPVVAGVAGAIGTEPFGLVACAALAATWGFMMPAGTPPNAIAYGTGAVRVPEMIRAGFWVDLLGLAAIPASVWLAIALFR